MEKCAECKAEFHPGCCRSRTVAKLKGLIASGAMWQCEDCSKDTASFSGLERSMSGIQDSLAAVTARLSVVEEEYNILKEQCVKLRNENSTLLKRVRDAEWSIIDQDQYSRMENLEIRSVPQTGGEDVYAILEAISGALGVPFERQDISIAHRLRGPRDPDWLASAKKKRIKTTDLYTSFTPGPVFVNEHLTQHNKALLQHRKAGVRAKSLAYAWSMEGKVLVRVTQDSRAIWIYCSIQELDGLDHHPQTQPTSHSDTK
ncbi:hypothetical protein J6590_032524 [Homalodisca vitripennis]|nr:hypothetical protein J6590_032524 [Homalodisca vitripennis]